MQMETGRYRITREDERLALWHCHRKNAEFLGWFPVSGSEEDINKAIDRHSRTCLHNAVTSGEEPSGITEESNQ